ncbi:MAG: hypothetical protein ACM31L_13090 [Actinomycetota bacterium]
MDLLELMAPGREEKSLDRLQAMVESFESEDEAEQGEALERAMNFCEREWGSYKAGMDLLARRMEARTPDRVHGAMLSLRLREEADEPGSLIRAARARRAPAPLPPEVEPDITRPTDTELALIEAAAGLGEPGPDGQFDPYAPLAGWMVDWHEVPEPLREVVSAALPLPVSVAEARAECLRWEARLAEIEAAFGCDGTGSLPTACAARRKVVEELWRSRQPARSLADVAARLEYWVGRGGDDGSGYRVLAADVVRLADSGVPLRRGDGTKDRARRLREQHPDWSLARIGKELGISRQAVHKHLKPKR